jgi:mRNA interferase MazF
MNYQAGDLVLVAYPFTGGTQAKVRPALVVLDTGDADILAARMTTESVGTPYDVPLTGWRQAGLNAPSTVRLHKLATLEKLLIRRVLGQLGAADRQAVAAVLKQLISSW